MVLSKQELFEGLMGNFLEVNSDVEAIIVSDLDGLIIAGKKRSSVDMEIVSVLTAIINPILERIRDEFAFKKFGTASFDTDEYRLLFISVTDEITLSIVLNNMASVDLISPYAYFLAEKSAQILTAEEDDLIQVAIPNFEYEGESSDRLKEQIYQMRLDTGGEYRFKFIIIGEHEVGKTSIVRRFVEKKFSRDYRATLGLNILSHKFEFVGNQVSVSLWDVGAQVYFKRFRKTYYMGAQAAFIVFDLTKKETHDSVKQWYDELEEFIGKPDLPIVIVGNKLDLEDKRQVKYQEGVQLANDLSQEGITNISYIETSALTGDNVSDAFSLIAYHYIMKSKDMEEKRLQSIILDELNEIMAKKSKLHLDFYTNSLFWNPALQIFTEIKELGEFKKERDEKEEKLYQYESGLTLHAYTFDNISVTDSDGVFCIFDARKTGTVDAMWKESARKMIEQIGENKIILIGIRVSEDADWSQILENFNLNAELEKKMVSLLFFKIGDEYRLEIYDQLEVMLNTVKNLA